MDAHILDLRARDSWVRRLLIWFGLISIGIGAIALSLYLWTRFQLVPAGNWLVAILGSLAILSVAMASTTTHGSNKTAWPAIMVGTACTVVGFFWGLQALFLSFVAAQGVVEFIAWLRRRVREP